MTSRSFDTTKRILYIALAAVLARPALAAADQRVHGVPLPANAVKVEEDRYRISESFEEVQKYYRRELPAAKYPRKAIRNQSGVRAVHIANPAAKGDWEGVNIYELPSSPGEVRVFILATQ